MLNLAKEVFDKLPPSTRSALQREHQPPQVVQRRPQQDYKPTAEEQAELDAITDRDARVTRYRQMRDQAAQTQ
jgi:hypothetical protein